MIKKNKTRQQWLDSLESGDIVYWNDPDKNISSGKYKIIAIEKRYVTESTIFSIKGISGACSEAEVPPQELTPVEENN